MKKSLLLLLSVIILTGCKSGEYYLCKSTSDIIYFNGKYGYSSRKAIPKGEFFVLKTSGEHSLKNKIRYKNQKAYTYFGDNAVKYKKISAKEFRKIVYNHSDSLYYYKGSIFKIPKHAIDNNKTKAVNPSSVYSGGKVHVKGYRRKDGTYVRSHTRSAPRRKR